MCARWRRAPYHKSVFEFAHDRRPKVVHDEISLSDVVKHKAGSAGAHRYDVPLECQGSGGVGVPSQYVIKRGLPLLIVMHLNPYIHAKMYLGTSLSLFPSHPHSPTLT